MRIFWTKKSQFRFQEINTYISTEFGEQSSMKFRNKVFDFLELLERFPELGTLEVAEKIFEDFKSPNRPEFSIESTWMTSAY